MSPKKPSSSRFLRLIKPLSKTLWFRRFVAFLTASYIRFVFGTTRWVRKGEEYPRKYWEMKKPVIVCFWHRRLLMVAYVGRSVMPFSMLISAHTDGELIARTVGHLGIGWIPGSSSHKGLQALRSLLQALKKGSSIGMTPDGPRGPCHQVSEGIVRLSLMSGVDILPLSFSIQRHRFLSSWDRFLVAFPFSRGVFVWGKPLSPDTYGGRPEEFRIALQKALMEVTECSDDLCHGKGR
jgi:hypothetical protein